MPECPHCSQEIEKLEGFIHQDTHVRRLNEQKAAKDGEISQLKASLTEAQEKAQAYDGLVSERDTYRAELEGIKTRATRTEALSAVGLKSELLESVEMLYNSAIAGVEDAPDFGAWLEESGRAHPLLSPHFAAPAGEQQQPPAQQPPRPRSNQTPRTEQGAHAPAAPTKMSPADIQAYLRSPEYAALDSKGKREELARLKSEAGL